MDYIWMIDNIHNKITDYHLIHGRGGCFWTGLINFPLLIDRIRIEDEPA